MSDVGKRLKEERDRKHLTQIQVFTKTGINNKTLSGYENGVSSPDYESLKILADYYDVSTDYLLGVEIKDASIEETFTPDQKKAADMYKKITDPVKQQEAISYMEFLLSQQKEKPTSQ